MMLYKVCYTQKALADLDAVADYIKLKLCNISASDRIVENFFGEGGSLVAFPTRYPLCNDALLRAWGIRQKRGRRLYACFYDALRTGGSREVW